MSLTILFLGLVGFISTANGYHLLLSREIAQGPMVNIFTATLVGKAVNDVEVFSGIPFAEPPIRNLRLRPPQKLTRNIGLLNASDVPAACPQQRFRSQDSSLIANLSAVLGNFTASLITPQLQSEDCLTVTVIRPEGTTGTDKLPVLFYIHGGSFAIGSSTADDPTMFIKYSVELNKPFIFVAVNYRVNGFGFLPGEEVAADGSSNLGLLDQRMGLEWVAEHIQAFGGDPDKVTIWGISAGSISVFNQMALYGGNHTSSHTGNPLFRGAIMSSGSIIPVDPIDSEKAQNLYNRVVRAAGCSTANDTLQCLRETDFETFINAISSEPGPISYAGFAAPYIPRPDRRILPDSPERLAASGQYAAVPFIVGVMEDEGTFTSLFQTNLTTTSSLVEYLKNFYFNRARDVQLTQWVELYGSGLSAVFLGSPFRTGMLNEISPGFKRRAAIIGDLAFSLTRRMFLAFASVVYPNTPSWSFLGSFNYGTPVLGTMHGSDITPLFVSNNSDYVARRLRAHFISFIHSLDPNDGLNDKYGHWPQWNEEQLQLQILPNTTHLLADTYRSSSYDWILNNIEDLHI